MFLSFENTLINLDFIARLDYIQGNKFPYVLLTYKNGETEELRRNDGKPVWDEFQYIRQNLLRKDCIIPINGEVKKW